MTFQLFVVPWAGGSKEWQEPLNTRVAQSKDPLVNEPQDPNIPTQGGWSKIEIQERHPSAKLQGGVKEARPGIQESENILLRSG